MSNKIRQPYSNNAFGLTRAKIHNFQYRTHVGIGLLMKILPAGLTACDENNMSHAMVLPVPADLTACRTYATSIRQLAKLAQSVRTACTGKHHDTHHIARRQVCGHLTACSV